MLAGKRILIVDDEQTIANSLVMIFSSHGYECKAANSAEDAKELVLNWRPDLAIIDVRLLGNDGVALAIEVQEQWPGCKVALFTGLNLDLPQAKEHDFEIIPKPIHPAEILKLVAKLLSPSQE